MFERIGDRANSSGVGFPEAAYAYTWRREQSSRQQDFDTALREGDFPLGVGAAQA